MECVSLKNLLFLKIHENGLFKYSIFEKLPPILREEFRCMKRCCFFSYGKLFSFEEILKLYEKTNRSNFYDSRSLYDMVRWFVDGMCLEAARNGHLKCFMFSMEKGFARTCWKLKHEQNDDINGLEVVVNSPTKEFQYAGHIWDVVFKKGHDDFVRHGLKLGFSFNKWNFRDAAKNGHLNILTCPELTNGIDLDYELIVKSAAKYGYMDVLEYCLNHWKDQITQFIRSAIKKALKETQTNVLTFLFINAKEHFSESVWIDVAFYRGNEEFMKFGLDNKVVMTNGVWIKAAERENLKILRIAIERKIPLDERVWVEAALHGNFSCLKLAALSGFSLGENVWIAATTHSEFINRSVPCFLVAFRHDIHLSDNVWKKAVECNNRKLLQAAWAFGINFSDDVIEAIKKHWDLSVVFTNRCFCC